jgi:hypothetical protein
VLSGLVRSEKEVEGVYEIIDLMETLYSPFYFKQTHVHSSNQCNMIFQNISLECLNQKIDILILIVH